MKKIITAKHIFDGQTLHENTVIVIEENIISGLFPIDKIPNQKEIINYGDYIISPGFIDLQLNGCGGVSFNENISHSTLETMYQTCLKYGTTSFLPTLITCDFKDVLSALECIKEWFARYESKRGVIGLHLEGPFISEIKKGIHPQEYIIKPTDTLLEQIIMYSKYFPIKMTIAPEVFTKEQIQSLIKNGIILALGHSNATYAEAEGAIRLGVCTATHMFNAMSGLNSRNPGVIGAIFNNNVYTGLIADLIHVDMANIQILNKLKPGLIYLVTDAVTPMGTNLKHFTLGGKTLYVKDGMCLDKDNVLGGSYLTMPQAVANCINPCQIGITDALNMATHIPAHIMGYGHTIGKINKGYLANLILFDPTTANCQIIT